MKESGVIVIWEGQAKRKEDNSMIRKMIVIQERYLKKSHGKRKEENSLKDDRDSN